MASSGDQGPATRGSRGVTLEQWQRGVGQGTNKATVATPSSTYNSMASKWELINCLIGGTDSMRAAGTKYLPQYGKESWENYKERLCRTVLFNGFSKTLSSMSAEPFKKEMKIGDVPSELQPMIDSIDGLGHNLSAFAQDLFKDGLAKGLTHILVDYPPMSEDVKTLADEQKRNSNPYFCHVKAESLIAAYAEEVDGVEKLVHVRILESSVVRDGTFGERHVLRVRVLEPGTCTIWQMGANKKWVELETLSTTLDFIPLVTFYTERTGLMESTIPLLDLAHKNLEHWQSSSDQRNALTVARFPILAASGLKDVTKVTLGPKKILSTDDPAGKFYYLEHTGSAIEAGQHDLDTIKAEMASLGMALLVKQPGTKTATESSIDKAEELSDLGRMAVSFADAIATAFQYAGEWKGIKVDKKKLKIELHTDFGVTENDAADLDAVAKARSTREISHKAYITELKRRGTLSPNFDADEDQELLDAEPPPLGLLAPARPGQPPTPGAPPKLPGPAPVPPAPKKPALK